MADEVPWYAQVGAFPPNWSPPQNTPNPPMFRDPAQAGPAPPVSDDGEILSRDQVYPPGSADPNEMYAIEGRNGTRRARGGKMAPRRQPKPKFVDQVENGRAVLLDNTGTPVEVMATHAMREGRMSDGSAAPDLGMSALRQRLGASDPGGPISLEQPKRRRVVP